MVPENYASKVSKGTDVMVEIPDINKSFAGKVSFISQTIGTLNRGFTAEIKVPAGMALRPNQIALVKILDYSAPNAFAIPVNTLATDENGKFVLVAVKEGERMVAKKNHRQRTLVPRRNVVRISRNFVMTLIDDGQRSF